MRPTFPSAGLLCFTVCLGQAWARSAPGCAIVNLSGQAAGEAAFSAMGAYELQDVLHDGKPVYRAAAGSKGASGHAAHFLYHAGGGVTSAARWQVAARLGATGKEVLLTVRDAAAVADRIRGAWSARDATSGRLLRVSVAARCKAKCKIVSIRGEREGDPQENAMGDYVIQPRLNDGRPVYKFMDDSFGSRFLFFSRKYKSWNVGQTVGGDQFEMFVSNGAFTPDQITGTWKVSAKGSFVPNDAVGAQCAASCDKVRLAGLREGAENSDCMGYYVQMDAMNDNKPVYKLADGNKFLYYSPFYENWNVGGKIGADKFDLFVTSKAKTADGIAGVWKVARQGKFVAHPEVRTSCAEDVCAGFTMVTSCSSHFGSSGCGWCEPTQQCAARTFCKAGWSRHAKLTKVITDKQSTAALFAGADAMDGADAAAAAGGGGAGAVSKKMILVCSGVAGLLVVASWCMLLKNDAPKGAAGAMHIAAGAPSHAYGGGGGGGGAGAYQSAGTDAGSAQRGSGYQVSSLLA